MDRKKSLSTFCDCLFEPDDLVEVRTLKDGTPPTQDYWKASEIPDHTDELKRMNDEGRNIYFGANPRNSNNGSATGNGTGLDLFIGQRNRFAG